MRRAHAGSGGGRPFSEALGLLLSFVVVTLPVALGATEALDRGLSHAVRGLPLPWLGELTTPVNRLGSLELTAALVLILVVRIAPAQSRQALTLLGVFAAIVAVEVLLKHWLSQPGMAAQVGLDQLLAPAGSYPSGHAARVVFLAVTLANLVPTPWLSLLLAGWVLLTMLVALSAGWHWPCDLLGGGLLGYGAASFVRELGHR